MKYDSLKKQQLGPNNSQTNLSNCKHCIIDFNFNVYFFYAEGFSVINNLI